jgi:cytochrome c-type protein NapC
VSVTGWWQNLRQRCATCSRVTLVAGIVLATLAVSLLFMTVGAYALAYTNTEEFCISCHEMRDNVYAEFKGTIHDKNRSGVRAICSSCHVPHEPVALVIRKMQASLELWGHFTGKIDTKEKFEKHRYQMAVKEWTRMKKNNSQECRNCHHFDAMEAEKQSETARARHVKAKASGTACIDCHFGIAHKEPDGPGPREIKVAQ